MAAGISAIANTTRRGRDGAQALEEQFLIRAPGASGRFPSSPEGLRPAAGVSSKQADRDFINKTKSNNLFGL
jgi:hypothetical protein